MAGGLGLEPRLMESKSTFLPLEDPPKKDLLLALYAIDSTALQLITVYCDSYITLDLASGLTSNKIGTR